VFTRKSFKSFIVISFLLLTISTSSAQNEVLSSEAKKEYYSGKLSIEKSHRSLTSGIVSNLFVSDSSPRWQAYEGYKKINEETFLEAAGYFDEAKIIRGLKTQNRKRLYGGMVLTAVGTGFFLIVRNNHEARIMNIPGAIFSSIGLNLMVRSRLKIGMSYIPASTATSMADDYNNQLMLNISKKF
jgi:hypothetical protein